MGSFYIELTALVCTPKIIKNILRKYVRILPTLNILEVKLLSENKIWKNNKEKYFLHQFTMLHKLYSGSILINTSSLAFINHLSNSMPCFLFKVKFLKR